MSDQVGREPIHQHALAWIRAARVWTHQDVADTIAAHSRKLRLGSPAAQRQKVRRWEHMGVVPDMRSQQALAAALDVSLEQVRLLSWPRWLPTGQNIRTDYAWTDDGTRAVLTDTLEYAVQDRRGFLTLTGALLTTVAGGWAGSVPAVAKIDRATADGGRIDEEVLAWIDAKVPTLRRMDDRLGGEVLRNVIDADLRVVNDLLSRASLIDSQRLRLQGAAAELAQLAGWVSFDSGLQSAGQRYYQAGLHAAQSADDSLLGANVLACMSFQSALTGHPHDGIELAQAAQASVKASAGVSRVKAMIATREARAHAKAGNHRECGEALQRAERFLESATDSGTEPEWVYYFDEAELVAQVGACWLDLRQPQDALRLLDRALDTIDPSYVRDRTIYHVRQASAHLQLGELEYSCDLLHKAIGLALQSRSARSVATIQSLRERMDKHAAEPAVRALDEHLLALTA
ncbi:tetratricopeptide (TPR) repeat protein [Kribbella aluminosa]|uniref:Tetratricopeptide (TPR) repeat protein n=1 Tax=Kribbella aluminosa TaxID=416017 RepID=A0ABS4UTK5_9ACTN|nr:hypothetical protein [Kribbella aluminosa]MBP2354962.1 tetratricopeptide (TPR) repeat protein [Kribbella aluminosa]